MTSQNNPLVTLWRVRQGSKTPVAVSGPWEIDGGVSGCTSREMGIRVIACHYASLAPAGNEQCINKPSIGLIADVNVRLIDEALVTRR